MQATTMMGTVDPEVVAMGNLRIWDAHKGSGTFSQDEKTGEIKIRFDAGESLSLKPMKRRKRRAQPTPHPTYDERQLTLDFDA